MIVKRERLGAGSEPSVSGRQMRVRSVNIGVYIVAFIFGRRPPPPLLTQGVLSSQNRER